MDYYVTLAWALLVLSLMFSPFAFVMWALGQPCPSTIKVEADNPEEDQ